MDTKRLHDKIEVFKRTKLGDIYTFLPVATEKEVAYFETTFNVKIPSDLRWFVLNIANGIKSIYPTDNIIDQIDFEDYYYKERDYNPSIPFEGTQRIYHGEEVFDEDNDYPYGTTYDNIFKLGYRNGYVCLVSSGCGAFDFIIVNGSEYGNVWANNISSMDEIYPSYDKKLNMKRLGFEDWLHQQMDYRIKIHLQAAVGN
jgi:hypothetical protein